MIDDCIATVDPWKKIDTFIEKHKGEHIFGYIGFDLHRFKISQLTKAPYPSIQLFVANEVVNLNNPIAEDEALSRVFDLKPYCQDPTSYIEAVKRILTWIDGRSDRRLTVARMISIREKLDLLSVLKHSSRNPEVSRLLYVRLDDLEIAGNSPELLAQGDTTQFRTYKLSGTASKEYRKNEVLLDLKLKQEHSSSIESQYHSLSQVGDVTRLQPIVLELNNLYHIMTEFKTLPKQNSTITDCLRSVFPSGARPYEEGLQKLSSIEQGGRGAYYGLCGVVYPNGFFEFSQVLRSFIQYQENCFCWVGAAITKDSSPEQEAQEICVKLGNFPRIEFV